MAIRPTPVYASQADIESQVSVIVNSLGDTAQDYEQAIKMYNSDFFKGEDPLFVVSMASALQQKFEPVFGTNYLWQKLSKGDV